MHSIDDLMKLSSLDYMMNFHGLKDNEYCRIWINDGPYQDYKFLIEDLSFFDDYNEDNSETHKISFSTVLIDWPEELTQEHALDIFRSDEFRSVCSWILNDMTQRAIENVDDSTTEALNDMIKDKMKENIDIEDTYHVH